MLFLIALLALIVYLTNKYGETAGVIGMAVLIVVLIILFVRAWVKDTKAYGNYIDYWSMDGKDRARARRRWNEEAKQEENRVSTPIGGTHRMKKNADAAIRAEQERVRTEMEAEENARRAERARAERERQEWIEREKARRKSKGGTTS